MLVQKREIKEFDWTEDAETKKKIKRLGEKNQEAIKKLEDLIVSCPECELLSKFEKITGTPSNQLLLFRCPNGHHFIGNR